MATKWCSEILLVNSTLKLVFKETLAEETSAQFFVLFLVLHFMRTFFTHLFMLLQFLDNSGNERTTKQPMQVRLAQNKLPSNNF